MEDRLKIALVKYTNTLPYLRALDSSKAKFDLIKASPSECVKLFKNGDAQAALLPVAALDELGPHRVIKTFGIGCDGPVHTVKILSKKPIDQTDSICFDEDSRSSIVLSEILLQEFWNIEYNSSIGDVSMGNHDTILAIGDKVIELESDYRYHYDLGEAWKTFTGQPFVFAIWVVNSELPNDIDSSLEESFASLEEFIDEIVLENKSNKAWIESYLRDNLDYRLTDLHMKGMCNYLEKLILNSEVVLPN